MNVIDYFKHIGIDVKEIVNMKEEPLVNLDAITLEDCIEMKEFKKIMNKRIDDLERKNMQCQGNPSFCANARRLDEHIKNDNGRLGRTLGIIGCVLSCISVGIVVVGKLNK